MRDEGQAILLQLAQKQDKFEHEYSSELVTRIGLFLVFAGFISAVSFNLLGFVLETASTARGWAWISGFVLLCCSSLFLFVAMIILLRSALLPGYSVPGKVSEYRQKYAELLEYHEKKSVEAASDLEEWILDATAEAVDTNATRNEARAVAISRASRFLLLSLVLLFTSAALVVIPRVLDNPSPPSIERSAGPGHDDVKEEWRGQKESKEKKAEEQTEAAPE